MLRYQIRACQRVLQTKVWCSTSTSDNFNKPNILTLQLMSEFQNISCIKKSLQNNEISNIHFDEWKSRIYLLKKFGFSDGECFMMISRYHYLLKIPLLDLEKSLKQWFLSDIGLNNFSFLILHQPQLLEVNVSVIKKRVPLLRIHFRSSNSFCQLLVTSPNVMFDNWVALMEKLNYVKNRRFTMKAIIDSQVLSKPLYFIKFRFELLEKCGIYKQDHSPVHKLNIHDKTQHKNPSLKEILNPDGKKFSEIAKISHEEFAVCKELYLEETYKEHDHEDEDSYS